jgi:hypothetical protein
VLAEAPETQGTVTALESPVSTAHEYHVQIDVQDPTSNTELQMSVGLGEFKRTWLPYERPRVEGKSAWDRLIWGDDLV